MRNKTLLLVFIEITWWVITGVVVWAVLSHIYKAMYVWPFRNENILFIITLITLARYTFLLKHSFLAKRQILKIVLMLAMIPLAFVLLDKLNGFMAFVEDHTWDMLTGHLPQPQKAETETYLWTEMLFFGVGSIIATPVFAVRLMISIWRTHNLGTT